MAGAIVVVGSINTDLVVQAPHHPVPGETVLGKSLQFFSGGKGANQAVAISRMGSKVKLIGKVGSDVFGSRLLESLEREGVDISLVRVEKDAASGAALICVDSEGQNTIVVAPGANQGVTPEYVTECEAAFADAPVVVVQLETPIGGVRRAAELGKKHGARVVLNPAPAAPLDGDLLALIDDFIPNQHELASISGLPSVTAALAAMRERGVKSVVVTLGADGAILATHHGQRSFSPHSVAVVDTTAAGDAFVGAYAAAISRGQSAEAACEFGMAAGALAVTRPGAQSSLPRMEEVKKLVPHLA